MSNLCKITSVIFVVLFLSCAKHNPEPFFEDIYVYKNTLPSNVSIDFYGRNSKKTYVDVIDSISVNRYHNNFNYTFYPSANDSIIIRFFDGKKVVFRSNDINSENWNLNPMNFRIYKETQKIDGNLTTTFHTYAINNEIYGLAK